MALDKLGPHALANTEPVRRWAAQAPIVKQFQGTDVLEYAKAVNPNVITVCRPIHDSDLSSDGGEAAQQVRNFYGSGFRPDYTEIWNEGETFSQRLWDPAPNLADYVREMRRAVDALSGIKVAGFSFSVGQPGAGFDGDSPDWEYLRDQGFAGVAAIALHEYWFGPPPFDGALALRYRRAHDIIGGWHPPIIITECGRHYNGPDDWGWQKTELEGNPQGYVNELAAYAGELLRDNYVIGANVFTNGNGSWWTFDTDPLVDYILGGVFIPPPGPSLVGIAAGLLIGGAAVALLALDLAGVTGEIAVGPVRRQFLGPEIVEVPALELEPGQPIPPGYEVVG